MGSSPDEERTTELQDRPNKVYPNETQREKRAGKMEQRKKINK